MWIPLIIWVMLWSYRVYISLPTNNYQSSLLPPPIPPNPNLGGKDLLLIIHASGLGLHFGPRWPQTTGWWWRNTQISRKRLAVPFPTVKSPLYRTKTWHVVNYILWFGDGMSSICLKITKTKTWATWAHKVACECGVMLCLFDHIYTSESVLQI